MTSHGPFRILIPAARQTAYPFEYGGQPEPRVELVKVEPGDGADPVARRGQHDQPGRGGGRPARVAEVAAEGGLGVGPGGYQVHAPLAAEPEAGLQEGPDRGGALVLVRRRGHGQPGVVGQQRDHALDVGGGVGAGEAPGQGAFLR